MNAMPRQTSTLAIISLVAGILGWTVLPFLASIAAVICGHMARKEIRLAPDRLEGDGRAIAGLVLGYLSIAMLLLIVVGIFLLFGGLAAFLAYAN
ncbi:MAG: DUF4190 domain-containing protein [Thermomonas sp.]